MSAGPLFDTSTPTSFFTNVASRLLSTQLGVNLSHLEVYPTNQYTPSVHRLLQVTANIWDAQNTNFYPSVFRPLFSADASNDIFIIGYQQVTNVSGPSDPKLASPYDVAGLLNFASNAVPIADSNGPVNVFGAPWVIGAKQGLPNFNQLSMVTAAQVTRKLEVTRDALNPAIATYGTNQMYVIGISNNLGISFWNSYSNAYPRPLTVYASDVVNMVLTNGNNGIGYFTWNLPTNFVVNLTTDPWPGSQWSARTLPNVAVPNANSFLSFNWSYVFLSQVTYNFDTRQFDNLTNEWWSVSQYLQLDQFGLLITNCLQAYILDGSNVIDYVQLSSPTSSGGLNQALADPDYPQAGTTRFQWSTNAYSTTLIPWGVINQIMVSENPSLAPPTGGQWSTAPTPMGVISPQAEAAYFHGFFIPTFQYTGQTYVNTQLVMQAPYTPTRTVYASFLLQANDPLVHYLASDLNGQLGALALWSGRASYYNGLWTHSDDPQNQPLPIPPATPIGGRYQPWGRNGQMVVMSGVDVNPYNLAYKDPLVWGSDYWNFPTGQNWSLSWLGQVHRGTPWQTIYLKSTNILININIGLPIGLRTWFAWTGDFQSDLSGKSYDSPYSAPVMDWQTISLLSSMLNTNDLSTLFSVNNPDPNAWAAQLDGMTALTNTAPAPFASTPPQFSPIVISSNSTQAAIIANAILSTEANANLFPNQKFPFIGGVLATPQLSDQSPFLNLSSHNGVPVQQEYGISDQACEAIPSQLLPLLRVDSFGQIISTNGQMQVQFSGYDGHAYAIQVSTDLLNWTSVSTNSPVNGVFGMVVPAVGNTASQFYRTVLVQ